MRYAEETTIYAVIPRPLLFSQMMKSLNRDLVAIYYWCLKWHMRLNIKKIKSIVVSRIQTYAPGNDDLTLGGVELEELKNLRILEVTFAFDSKLTFETHLREVVSKAAGNLGVVRRVETLFDCPRLLKSCFNTYVLPNLEYCGSMWMSSAESHLSLLDSVVRSAEKLCEGDLCGLRHGRCV